jgi:hypothetical protein
MELMTLFAGPIALYPRGRGQWESRAVCAVSFISGNGSASKERARRVVPKGVGDAVFKITFRTVAPFLFSQYIRRMLSRVRNSRGRPINALLI